LKRFAYFAIALNLLIFFLVQYGNRDLQRGDFKMFYTAAVALRSGHRADLYDPSLHMALQQKIVPDLPRSEAKVYTHPPFELLAYLPLSFFSYRTACYLWLAIFLALSFVAARALGNYVPVFGSFPMLIAVLEQQDSILILLAAVGCWAALRKERWMLAGVMLGAGLIRFPIFIPAHSRDRFLEANRIERRGHFRLRGVANFSRPGWAVRNHALR
jgi:lipid-A-disaccharide synthase-like uncharacterized protein